MRGIAPKSAGARVRCRASARCCAVPGRLDRLCAPGPSIAGRARAPVIGRSAAFRRSARWRPWLVAARGPLVVDCQSRPCRRGARRRRGLSRCSIAPSLLLRCTARRSSIAVALARRPAERAEARSPRGTAPVGRRACSPKRSARGERIAHARRARAAARPIVRRWTTRAPFNVNAPDDLARAEAPLERLPRDRRITVAGLASRRRLAHCAPPPRSFRARVLALDADATASGARGVLAAVRARRRRILRASRTRSRANGCGALCAARGGTRRRRGLDRRARARESRNGVATPPSSHAERQRRTRRESREAGVRAASCRW